MHHPTTRRQFLHTAALAAAGAGPLVLSRPARAITPLGRTRPGHLKLSLAAYSYRKFLAGKPPQMDLFDFVNLAADMGLDAVELTSYYFPPDVDNEYLHRLKQHAFVLGLDVSGTSVGNDFCVAPGPERDKQMELVRTWVDHAAELDAPVIRIFAGRVPKGDSEEVAVARAIEGIKASLPYAAEKGVSLALENHGGITATPEQFLKLVRGDRCPQLRRQPRHRQLPHRGPLRRPRQDRPLRDQRPGEDRDQPRRQAARKRPTWPGSSTSSARPAIRAMSSSNMRPATTPCPPFPVTSRRSGA